MPGFGGKAKDKKPRAAADIDVGADSNIKPSVDTNTPSVDVDTPKTGLSGGVGGDIDTKGPSFDINTPSVGIDTSPANIQSPQANIDLNTGRWQARSSV